MLDALEHIFLLSFKHFLRLCISYLTHGNLLTNTADLTFSGQSQGQGQVLGLLIKE